MSGIAERVLGLVQASGLTRREFGRRIGLDESKMSKSLSGVRRFSSLDLARIAELTRTTVDWLVTGEEPVVALAARTTSGDAGRALDIAERYAALRVDMAFVGYPQPWRATADVPATSGFGEQGRRLARVALDRVRQAGYSTDDEDLITIVEETFGVDVAVVELGTGFDGLAVASEEVKLIILAASHIPARQRFTLAHELGHLLAGDNQDIHLDRDVFDRAQIKDPSEARANAFASAFLMPEEVLRDAVESTEPTEENFATLACDLSVTPAALAFRMLHLRLIDAGTCDRYKMITGAAAARIAGRGRQFANRVAEAGRPRSPGLLVRDTYAAYASGATTLRPYAGLLGVDVDELRRALESEHRTHDAP